MECSIDTVFEYLSLNNSIEMQRQGIKLASDIKYLSVLIMPVENKSVWDNCAKVIASKSDDELKLYFVELFKWLKDMNWPGAYVIYDRLLSVSMDYFVQPYRYCFSIASQTNDYAWKRSLEDLFVDYIYNLIDSNESDDTQSKGIALAAYIDDINPFLKPLTHEYDESVRENCALIISNKSDEMLKPYLTELLTWLKDIHLPGAICILNRLKNYTYDNTIYNAIDICLEKAKRENDLAWQDNLEMLLSNVSI